MTEVKLIIQIGKTDSCSTEELHFFLPNYPKLRGSEFIFKIGFANSYSHLKSDIEYFIKGLHLIELKFRSINSSDFGFGSPSPTYRLILSLPKKDSELAQKLTDWVLENGGNYYIKTKKQ